MLCSAPAVDAHHVMERRLFPDGGYYLENGASVCSDCHLRCERTQVGVEAVRQAAAIRHPMVPPHLWSDQPYDKWGNPILADGKRGKGELFFEDGVQKALAEGGVLPLFIHRCETMRRSHLPWSPLAGLGELRLSSLAALEGQRVIATSALPGECLVLYADGGLHGAQVGSEPAQGTMQSFLASRAASLPEGWRLVVRGAGDFTSGVGALDVEVWDGWNTCLPWDETQEWLALLDLPVPIPLFDGPFSADAIQALGVATSYLIRLSAAIPAARYRLAVGQCTIYRRNDRQL